MKKVWRTRSISVGGVLVGADNPIRVQSMTTTPTHEIEKTVDQIMALADAGCEIARVTVQGMREAKSCEGIKNLLIQKGYQIPLVADIHFFPKAAMHVVDFVDKVRINPGNFADRRATFKRIEYTDEQYAEELEHIEEVFSPLVERCIKLGKALRIGTNHGSLSDRIMNRYGDTPFGMVESALEYARICRKMDFHHFCFSMKSSNPIVMIEAYRKLVANMMELGWDYPLHLGVTEAGEGEDGRLKSGAGIGALLLDGIGDTIRVSLTEDPIQEIKPAKELVALVGGRKLCHPILEKPAKRHIDYSSSHHEAGTCFVDLTNQALKKEEVASQIGCRLELNQWIKTDQSPDGVLCSAEETTEFRKIEKAGIPLHSFDGKETKDTLIHSLNDFDLQTSRAFFQRLQNEHISKPVMLSADPSLYPPIVLGAIFGSLLTDGLGEGVALRGSSELGFALLQAVRMRSSKTEFISCPGCGRTLFDLQKVSGEIRDKTAHLPGVKIAIMGCIVNGPGEMADADFGYVGSKPKKIDLYIGKECVERDIDMDVAVERLIALIKAHGKWVEPERATATLGEKNSLIAPV